MTPTVHRMSTHADGNDADKAAGPTDEPAEETPGMPEDVPDDPEHADELTPDSIVNEKAD